ncbi:hypothetical protein H5410_038466 [Solanum commersonii]|uniref:Uncharacterized protein n=1 Tax=Solanum commersonii TaxID=4109 RepID=A0A9J5YAR7_SOLCO|nr:hypothetical protein H5410_038466 [Solanum commersonii]
MLYVLLSAIEFCKSDHLIYHKLNYSSLDRRPLLNKRHSINELLDVGTTACSAMILLPSILGSLTVPQDVIWNIDWKESETNARPGPALPLK